MISALHPPRTMLEVWQSLPEGTLLKSVNLIVSLHNILQS